MSEPLISAIGLAPMTGNTSTYDPASQTYTTGPMTNAVNNVSNATNGVVAGGIK